MTLDHAHTFVEEKTYNLGMKNEENWFDDLTSHPIYTHSHNGCDKKYSVMVRRLTPRECFRIMGVSDKDINTIIASGISDTDMFKLAGNSIVVDVLYHMFRKLVEINHLGVEKPLRVATLCSGYDSQFMALDRLQSDLPYFKYERVFYAEFDPESIKQIDNQPAVIAHQALYPECKNIGDITKVDWNSIREDFGEIDLLFYSTPCTDISAAGLQKGFDEGSGTRSSIIWNVRDAIKAIKPRFACLENVKAMISKRFKPTFDIWFDELEKNGYDNEFNVLNAKDYDVPQNRERIFMMSSLKSSENGFAKYQFPNPVKKTKSLKDLIEFTKEKKYYIKDANVQKFVDDPIKNDMIHSFVEKELEMGNQSRILFKPLVTDQDGNAVTLTCAHHFSGNILFPRQGYREMGVMTLVEI